MGFEKIIDIAALLLEKCLPGRMEQYAEALQQLEVAYAKALQSGKDTEAASIRVQMVSLRKKLGVKDD